MKYDSVYGFDFSTDGESGFGSGAERDSVSRVYEGWRLDRGEYAEYYVSCGGYDGWTNYEEYSEDYDNF